MFIYFPTNFTLNQPDYDDIEDENQVKLTERGKSGKGKDNKKYGEFYDRACDLSSLPWLYIRVKRHINEVMTRGGHRNGFLSYAYCLIVPAKLSFDRFSW
jgi:hypothetical protein